MEYLQNMNLGDIGLYGGAGLGALGVGAGWQSMQDINAINQMAKTGNYGPRNPMPQAFMDKLKGAYTPSSVFKKTGYPAGLKDWFFSRSSPGHFGPVEKTMQFGKNLPGYAMKGLGYLASLPALAASMTLSSTPVGSAEMPEYGSEEYKALMAREALFRRKQKQANVFKQMKQKQLADEAAAKKTTQEPLNIEDWKKVKSKVTGPTYGPHTKPKVTGPTYGPHTKVKVKPKPKTKPIPDRGRGNGGGGRRPDKPGGFTDPGKGSYGPHMADGGLINFYKYGGFI